MSQRRSIVIALATIVLCAAAGFGGGVAGSYLHPGPVGARGVIGSTGPQGDRGPAGEPPSQLGICFSTHTSGSAGVYWVDQVSISSPTRHADGVVDCGFGRYIPVTPR